MLLNRDGEEWFHNRRLLSRMLLNGNLDWIDWHIRQQSNKLIQKWLNELNNLNNNQMEIQNLEKQLYRWSIDGKMKMKKSFHLFQLQITNKFLSLSFSVL